MQLSSEKEGNTVIYNSMDEPGESVHVYGHSAVSSSLQPRGVTHQRPLSMGFSRQEHWSGLTFPSPGDLPNPGTEHVPLQW